MELEREFFRDIQALERKIIPVPGNDNAEKMNAHKRTRR